MKGSRWKGPARALLFLALASVLAASGCGGTGTITGKVSYKGTPLKGGTVYFISAGGFVGQSPIEEDGTYTIPKMPPGEVTITVETDSVKPTGAATRASQEMT